MSCVFGQYLRLVRWFLVGHILRDFLEHRLALRQTGIEVVFGNLLVHQVLMAVDARGALRVHLLVRGLGGGARRPRILVVGPTG